MPEKKTLSGRVPADTEERFEEFRRSRGLNKTDAMRRLLEAGLESHESGGNATAADTPDVEIGPLTQSEEWFQQKFEGSLGTMLLSAPASLSLAVMFGVAAVFFPGDAAAWLPMQVLALLVFGSVVVFVMYAVLAAVTYGALKSGLARWLDGRGRSEENDISA